jgi:hypothetical protein
MDWQVTNGVGAGAWSGRPKRTDTSYVTYGAPLEDLLLLSNLAAADPWLCIPHLADDDYVRSFAVAVRDSLRPDRRAYIEYSNELWHTGFPGGQYVSTQGYLAGTSALCYTVSRLRNISRIFQDVFGPAGRGRFAVVVSSQVSNPDATRQILACPALGQAGKDIDAIALAPYFDGFQSSFTEVALMLASYDAGVNASLNLVRAHAALTSARNFSLYAYEAGPGSPVGTFGGAGFAAHRDPGMRRLVARYYSGLADAGLRVLLQFTSVGTMTKYGAFGLLEATDQDPSTAPKQQGLFDHMDARAVCPLPNATTARDQALCGGHGYATDAGGCSCFYGYSGPRCEDAQYTEHMSDCGYYCTFDQGVCSPTNVVGFERYWACKCGPGYWGRECSRFSCAGACSYNGVCVDKDVCSCFPGYSGRRCEVDCGCSGHGECGSGGGCVCDDGWRAAPGGGCEWDCDCPGGLPCSGPGVCACERCQFGTCMRGVCQCWAGYSGTECSVRVPRPNDGSPVGMNLAAVAYGMERVFVDVMKHSSGWVSVPGSDTTNTSSTQYIWGDGRPVPVDAAGFVTALEVTQEAVTLSLRDVCLHAASGRYVALYDGDGHLDFGMDARVMSRRKGRVDFAYTPTCNPACWFDKANWQPYCTDNGIYIRIVQVNPANPMRNIRLIMPGFVDRSHPPPITFTSPPIHQFSPHILAYPATT